MRNVIALSLASMGAFLWIALIAIAQEAMWLMAHPHGK